GALHPAGTLEQIDERNGGPGLPRPRGHDEERFPALLGELRRDAPDRPLLVVPPRDLLLHARDIELLPLRPAHDEPLQLVLLVEPRDLARRIRQIVPDPGDVAVR